MSTAICCIFFVLQGQESSQRPLDPAQCFFFLLFEQGTANFFGWVFTVNDGPAFGTQLPCDHRQPVRR